MKDYALYIFLSYGTAFGVLAALALASVIQYRRALAAEKKP